MTQGRPSDYTLELALEICDAIRSSSLGLKKLCKANPHWPHKSTILKWRSENPSFADLYLRAKADQVECLVDEIMEISDDDSRDVLETTNADGKPIAIINHAALHRDRLRTDNRKWLAGKLAPRIYGDKANVQENNEQDFISKYRDKL